MSTKSTSPQVPPAAAAVRAIAAGDVVVSVKGDYYLVRANSAGELEGVWLEVAQDNPRGFVQRLAHFSYKRSFAQGLGRHKLVGTAQELASCFTSKVALA